MVPKPRAFVNKDDATAYMDILVDDPDFMGVALYEATVIRHPIKAIRRR